MCDTCGHILLLLCRPPVALLGQLLLLCLKLRAELRHPALSLLPGILCCLQLPCLVAVLANPAPAQVWAVRALLWEGGMYVSQGTPCVGRMAAHDWSCT